MLECVKKNEKVFIFVLLLFDKLYKEFFIVNEIVNVIVIIVIYDNLSDFFFVVLEVLMNFFYIFVDEF